MSTNTNNIDVAALKAELAAMPKHRGPKTKREREILALLEEAHKNMPNSIESVDDSIDNIEKMIMLLFQQLKQNKMKR